MSREDYKPTCHLRWWQPDDWQRPILQQWWAPDPASTHPAFTEGEWRELPVDWHGKTEAQRGPTPQGD